VSARLPDQLLVADHAGDLHRRAAAARLAAVANCCRPGTWARAARRAGQRFTKLHRRERTACRA
jgi:hypothetical protein